jgi:hypothetical protein
MQQAEAAQQQLMMTGPLAEAAASGNVLIADIMSTHMMLQQLYHQAVKHFLDTYQQLAVSPAGKQPQSRKCCDSCQYTDNIAVQWHRLSCLLGRCQKCDNTWSGDACTCAGLCYCICCDLLGQQRELQPGDSITAKDLEALVEQAGTSVHKSDWPIWSGRRISACG